MNMKPYRIKHISTGLYFSPGTKKGLTKQGKVYSSKNNALTYYKDFIPVPVAKHDSLYQILKDKGYELNTRGLWFKIPVTDFEIEYTNHAIKIPESYNVVIFDINRKKFIKYDILDYLLEEYHNTKKKPETYDEFKKFIEGRSLYRFWSRCEYEVLLSDWPNQTLTEKYDVHDQIMMNIDNVTFLLMSKIFG